jgi:hypothetical protein
MLAHESKGARQGQVFEDLARLRRFGGPPAEFWPAYLGVLGNLIGACRGLLILRDSAQPDRLKKISDWSSNGHADRAILTFTRMASEIAHRCAHEQTLIQPLERGSSPETQHFAVALTVPIGGGNETCIAAFVLLNATEEEASEALARLQLASDIPVTYRLNQSFAQAKSDVEKFASVLDVMVLVNAEKRYLAAAMAFCNGLAARFSCDRVSLGWLEKGYIRLRAMSRTERFDRQMAAAQALEMTMEEALDQDEEVVWPPLEGVSLISKDHEKFAAEQSSGHICSLPLRVDEKPVAVLTCERQAKGFSETELRQLRLACDQASRRLSELKVRDRWFGARLAYATKELAAKAVGPEHTWAKVLALLGVAALVLLLLPIFSYRVEGTLNLRSDDVSFLTAPFDGYISQVPIRPGDPLEEGAIMLSLDTADLELEQAAALADLNRYLREAEKARAEAQLLRTSNPPSLAEMRISQALAEQAKARLELANYRLSQAQIRAPFNSVLVEGDLRQRVGAPVKQGEALFKIARIDTLYVEAEIDERDMHEILNVATGEIRLVTQPKLKFPVEVVRIEPAAVTKDNKNIFIVRCAFAEPIQPWWRPGMSGVCKLTVEKRTLLWILTHRTVDFLRLWLWW